MRRHLPAIAAGLALLAGCGGAAARSSSAPDAAASLAALAKRTQA